MKTVLFAPNVDKFIINHVKNNFEQAHIDVTTLSKISVFDQGKLQGEERDIQTYVEVLGKIAGNSPRCIIQKVWYSEFQRERKKRFFLKEPRDSNRSNPLLYRRALYEFKTKDKGINEFKYCSLPIIFIGDFALFYPLESKPDEIDDNRNSQGQDHPARLKLPERIYPPGGSDKLFMDSSIWHRYVPIWELDRLPIIIKEIQELSKLGIYATTIALEDLDYSIRMMRNQYVEDFDKGHGGLIGVHKFHSEDKVNAAIEAVKEKKEEDKVAVNRIRLLLVDDYSDTPLRLCGEEADGNLGRTKEACIKRLFSFSDAGAIQIEIDLSTAATIEEAVEKLKTQNYDILLLDYLFTIDSEGKSLDVPSYGNELLARLVAEGSKLLKGPGDHFWIMPSTVFPEAIRSEVDSANISQDEVDYTLFSGADPVCTPELFKYKFLKMIEIITRKITPSLQPFINLLIRLGEMENEPKGRQSSGDVRNECRTAFHYVVEQCGRYIQLKEDYDDSLLVKSLLNKEIRDVGNLLVRVQSFINDFVWGGSQKWASLHLEYDNFSRHTLLLKGNEKKQKKIQAGLNVLLDEINRKAERG